MPSDRPGSVGGCSGAIGVTRSQALGREDDEKGPGLWAVGERLGEQVLRALEALLSRARLLSRGFQDGTPSPAHPWAPATPAWHL